MHCRVKPGNGRILQMAEDYSAGAASGCAAAAAALVTAFCTFSKARTSICRMRSRETPNSAESSSSVSGSSASLRASNTRRSRSFKALQRVVQHAAALVALLGFGERRLLVHGVVDQPVLPLAALGVVPDRRVERRVAGKPPVHRHHVLLGHAELGGDALHLIGPQVALFERLELALDLAQIEEELLLRGGGAHLHQAPGAQDVFLDRRPDPPHGVGRKPEALVGIEALHRLHQPDIAFGDDLADRQPIAAIAHGDARHEPQMRGDELVRSVAVAMLAPALGEHVFLLRLQHRKLSDLFEVARQSAMRANTRQTSCGHESPSPAAFVGRDLPKPTAPRRSSL